MAKAWLSTQRTNRGVSRAHVLNFVHAIRTGKFHLTPGGIAFDEDGRLADGQHRLNAVVESDTPSLFRVHYNCTEDELRAIDQGRPRTVSDAMRINTGDTHACNKTPIVRLLLRLETGRNSKVSESLYEEVIRNLGTEHVDAICNIQRAKIAAPGLLPLVYARPIAPHAIDCLRVQLENRDSVLNPETSERLFQTRDTSARNTVLESMLRTLGDKQSLHSNQAVAAYKLMRGVQGFLENEPLRCLRENRRGYDWLRERRQALHLDVDMIPHVYTSARARRGLSESPDEQDEMGETETSL
jgi:hypothetical protein